MKLINLTNHEIKVMNDKGEIITVPPSGQIARVVQKTKVIDIIDGIKIYKTLYDDIVGLPEPKENTYYIVSAAVLNALNENKVDRKDCVAPYKTIRNSQGQPIAAEGLRING